MDPSIIDYPVSDTFAGGYADYYGWPKRTRCETLREARFRESIAGMTKSRIKGGEYTELRRRIERLEAAQKQTDAENAYLRAKVSERRAEQSPAAQMLKDLREMD